MRICFSELRLYVYLCRSRLGYRKSTHDPLVHGPLYRINNEGPRAADTQPAKEHTGSLVSVGLPGYLQRSHPHLRLSQDCGCLGRWRCRCGGQTLGLHPCLYHVWMRSVTSYTWQVVNLYQAGILTPMSQSLLYLHKAVWTSIRDFRHLSTSSMPVCLSRTTSS